MEDLSRPEYPAMLANLQPGQAVQTFSDRVKRIAKVNQEIADWLQERRKVEELYVSGLRKLLLFKAPNAQSELGVFQPPWDKILQSVDAIAASHHTFAQQIEKDVEQPLRSFQNKKDVQNLHTIGANLQAVAKELDDAQDKSDRLTKKGGKANAQKVDQAAQRLEAATEQWESQAPFVFETLQAQDEKRVNHLRDVLTQLETHEVDQAARTQKSAEAVLNAVLEVSTAHEVSTFAGRVVAGKPRLEKRPVGTPTGSATGTGATTTRQSSTAGSGLAAPPTPGHEDDVSDTSGGRELPEPNKLRSRIGTMFGRRRQSIHGGFGALSGQKGLGFSRGLSSSHGKTLSPRASSHNLAESNNRLASLVESSSDEPAKPESTHETANGVTHAVPPQPTPDESLSQPPPKESSSTILNGTAEDIFDAPPQQAPPSQHGSQEASKDADGFTVPVASNDPISQAQKDAAAASGEDPDRFFTLNIQKEPVPEEDPDAKKAALSNVTNTLTQMGMPARSSTVRGRRDVRNTVYMPSFPPPPDLSPDHPFPPSPALPATVASRPSAVSALASEASIAGTSDTQSVRSGISLGSLAPHRHPDMAGLGLNSSIIEYVSATFEDGELKTARVNGEIAFSYNADPSSSIPDRETIRINRFPALSAIGPNRIVVSNTPVPDEFVLDLSHLSARPAPSFTYRVHADEAATSLAPHCPLVLKPTWKPTGDKLALLVQYRLNPQVAHPVTLSNVVVFATYEGARASGAQSKPAGTHLKDKHVIYWRLGDITPTGDWQKIVCRIVGEQNAEPQPGHVEARWETLSADMGSGISVSRLVEDKGKGKEVESDRDEDPFADEATSPPPSKDKTWADTPLVRKLASGKYEGR